MEQNTLHMASILKPENDIITSNVKRNANNERTRGKRSANEEHLNRHHRSLENAKLGGHKLSDYHAGQQVTDLYRQSGVVEKVTDTQVQVRFEQDGSVHAYSNDELKAGMLAVVAQANIREFKKGRIVSHFHLGLGVIEKVSKGKVSVKFEDGNKAHVYDKKALATGKLMQLERRSFKQPQTQSIEHM